MAQVTADRVAAEYLAAHKPSTRVAYRSVLRGWFDWCARNDLPVLGVRRVHIEVWARWLADVEHKRPATITQHLSVIGGFYDLAHQQDYIATNPGAHVRRPRARRFSAGTWLTADQLRALLAAADAHPDPDVTALTWMLALNGFRLGETLSLDVPDVRTIDGRTVVGLARKSLDGAKVPVALARPSVARLAPLLTARRAGPLLREPAGQRMRGDPARVAIADLARRAGVDTHVTPHSLRRTFVTLGRDAGISDRDLMASTGHAGPEMLDYYDRARDAVERDGGDQLAAWLDLDNPRA